MAYSSKFPFRIDSKQHTIPSHNIPASPPQLNGLGYFCTHDSRDIFFGFRCIPNYYVWMTHSLIFLTGVQSYTLSTFTCSNHKTCLLDDTITYRGAETPSLSPSEVQHGISVAIQYITSSEKTNLRVRRLNPRSNDVLYLCTRLQRLKNISIMLLHRQK